MPRKTSQGASKPCVSRSSCMQHAWSGAPTRGGPALSSKVPLHRVRGGAAAAEEAEDAAEEAAVRPSKGSKRAAKAKATAQPALAGFAQVPPLTTCASTTAAASPRAHSWQPSPACPLRHTAAHKGGCQLPWRARVHLPTTSPLHLRQVRACVQVKPPDPRISTLAVAAEAGVRLVVRPNACAGRSRTRPTALPSQSAQP
jgi:hypothetical protein